MRLKLMVGYIGKIMFTSQMPSSSIWRVILIGAMFITGTVSVKSNESCNYHSTSDDVNTSKVSDEASPEKACDCAHVFSRILPELRELCMDGDFEAKFLLGRLSYVDLTDQLICGEEGGGLIQEAANGGNARAQFFLGMAYWHGTIVDPDLSNAEMWLKKAAENEYTPAQLNFGRFLIDEGGDENLEEAFDWFMTAAFGGSKAAMRAVSELQFMARGIPRDDEMAAAWGYLYLGAGKDDEFEQSIMARISDGALKAGKVHAEDIRPMIRAVDSDVEEEIEFDCCSIAKEAKLLIREGRESAKVTH